MAADFQVTGWDALTRAFAAWPAEFAEATEAASHEALDDLLPALATYPPERPGQRYIRTGYLGDMWDSASPEFAPLGSGFEAKIENPTAYAPFVQDAAEQAWMHVGRWPTDATIAKAAEPDIERTFAYHLTDAVRRLFE